MEDNIVIFFLYLFNQLYFLLYVEEDYNFFFYQYGDVMLEMSNVQRFEGQIVKYVFVDNDFIENLFFFILYVYYFSLVFQYLNMMGYNGYI